MCSNVNNKLIVNGGIYNIVFNATGGVTLHTSVSYGATTMLLIHMRRNGYTDSSTEIVFIQREYTWLLIIRCGERIHTLGNNLYGRE